MNWWWPKQRWLKPRSEIFVRSDCMPAALVVRFIYYRMTCSRFLHTVSMLLIDFATIYDCGHVLVWDSINH